MIDTPLGPLGICPDGRGVLPYDSGKVREMYWCLKPADVVRLAWACFLAAIDITGVRWVP